MKRGWYLIEGRILDRKVYAILAEDGLRIATPGGQMLPLSGIGLMSFTAYRAFKFKGLIKVRHRGMILTRSVSSYGEGRKYFKFVTEFLEGETIRQTDFNDIITRKWVVKDSGDWVLYEPFEHIPIEDIPKNRLQLLEQFGRFRPEPLKFELIQASFRKKLGTKYFNDGDELLEYLQKTYDDWVLHFREDVNQLMIYDNYIE